MITADPISMNDVTDTDSATCALEGEGANALKVCFESEDNEPEHLDIPLLTCSSTLSAAYARVADPDITGTIS
jgi:hypothetical protein